MNDFVGQWLALLPDAKMVLDLCAQENFTSCLIAVHTASLFKIISESFMQKPSDSFNICTLLPTPIAPHIFHQSDLIQFGFCNG